MSELARSQDQLTDPSEARLAQAFLAGDADALVREMGPAGVFHSPVATHEGSGQTAPVLQALLQVLRLRHVTSVLLRESETATFFTADVAGQRADGVLRTRVRRDGPPEVTLMIRPLDALLAGIQRLQGR